MFSNAPFAVGSVIGWRSFAAVDGLNGLMVGPMYPQVFTPGENKAFCLASSNGNPINYYDDEDRTRLLQWNSEIAAKGEPQTMPTEVIKFNDEHVGRVGCGCGFYCYWDDLDGVYQHNPGCVNTIVEGYGHVTYGPRGFRCQKMKIIGLVTPPHLGEVPQNRREKVKRMIKFRSFKPPKMTHTQGKHMFPPKIWDQIVAQYPDARVFPDLARARKAHPPTNPFKVLGLGDPRYDDGW